MHKTLVDDWLASKERVVLPDMQPLENYDGIHAPAEGVEKVTAMPDIVSKLKESVETVDQLKYFKEEVDLAADLPVLGPQKIMYNQAVYMGQFKDGLRHGRGIQIWKDRSIYEGMWEKVNLMDTEG
jgi:MORN repeat